MFAATRAGVIPVKAPPLVYATWNPADKSASSVLSNGNLSYATTVNGQAARATVGKSTGKWYYEVRIDGMGGLNNLSGVGVSDATDGLARGPGWHSVSSLRCSVGFSNNGDIVNGGSVVHSSGINWSAGDVIGVAFDPVARTVQFFKNGAAVSGTYGWTTSAEVFPKIGHSLAAAFTSTANFGATPLAYSPPSGFAPGVYA